MTENMNISPKDNNYLIGQTDAEEFFLRSWKNNSMHHAWIISGPKGIGKSTLAYRIARFLLWADKDNKDSYTSLTIPENSNIFKQVANNSNPDLMVIERDFIEADRKKIIKAIQKGEALDNNEISNMKKSAFIRVDDVRKVNEFLAKTSFNDGWRIVIIDSADDMNKNSANALLKILEEPPAKTILLLISHNPGILLPTIRSRCAKLPLKTLNNNEVASLLRRYRSNLNEKMIEKIANISNAVEIYDELCSILYAKNNFSTEKLIDFCGEMSSDINKFNLLQELLIKFIKDNMPTCSDTEALYECWNNINKMFNDCSSVNMDKRLMLINLISKICKVL